MRPARHAASRDHDLREFLAHAGEPAYRLTQLLHAVYRRGVTEFAHMDELPRRLRDQLAARYGESVLTIRPIATQRGPQVEKLLFESRQGARIETVLARYRSGWTSLCVSTRVGCGLGCTFCATGAVGLVRNLTVDEICDQVLYVACRERVDSVAFMGMGEALANPHTFAALRQLADPAHHALSPRRLTVSTVGFVPGLRRLVEEHPRVTITVSVHSPYEEERARLIPLQHRFPLSECLAVLDEHVAATRRKAYLAYLVIDGLNDTDAHARDLARLVARRRRPELFHVNVIPYNPAAGVDAAYRRPTPDRVRRFLRVLRERGVRATRRTQFGDSIDAACGQLHARYLGDARQSTGSAEATD